MEEVHRELLRRRQRYLVENVIMEEGLIGALRDKGLFTPSMVTSIMGEKDAEKQMMKMLEMIPKRGPSAYPQFLEVLQADYPWVVEHFREKEEELKQKGRPDVMPELRRTIKEYVKELARTTRINQAQQRAIEDFLCRHVVGDTHFSVQPSSGKVPGNKLFSIHKLLMSCIPLNSLDESDQMELKDLSPDAVTIGKIEREIVLLTHRVSDMQTTIDSCYEKLGETNKEKELPDLVYSMRKMYLEREIRVEELKSQVVTSTRQLRISKDRMRKAQEVTSKQEEEKEELTHSLDKLKTKIAKLQEERQRMGMKIAFDGVVPGTPRTRSSR